MADPDAQPARRCYWTALEPSAPGRALAGETRADVVIVGGGYTGLWSAYLLLAASPGIQVSVVEGEQVGYGASGRNGGFAMTLVHRSLTTLASYAGDEAAAAIHRAAKRAVESLTKTIAAEAIACDAEPTGLLVVSDTPPQDRRLQLELETAARIGVGADFQFLDRAAAQERIRSERIRLGYFEPHCTLVHPARLVRGLRDAVVRRGGRVYERSPVVDWEEEGGGVRVRSRAGTVRADRAVIALNAYGSAFEPTRRHVLPFYSYICLTRPLSPAEWESVGWRGREGAEDRRDGLHYFRPTADGRLLWGGRDAPFRPKGPDPRYDTDSRQLRRLRETFEWFFPQLRHVPFEYHWGGPISMTTDFLPVVGFGDRRTRRVLYAYGYSGHGVAITHLVGHAVRDLLAGHPSEWTDLYFVDRTPPLSGPIWLRNWITASASRAAFRADDEERRPRTPLTLKLAERLNRLLA